MRRTQIDPETVRSMYADRKMTVQEVAKEIECSENSIRKCMREHEIPSRRSGPRGGAMHPGWKGGVTTDKSGYILRYAPEHPDANVAGYVREHRLVMEKILGRRLLPSEVVHHIDDNPANNAPDNLSLFSTNKEHLQKTLKGKCPKWTPGGRERILAGLRGPKVAKDVPTQHFVDAYRETGRIQPIADRLGISACVVAKRLRDAGVKVDSRPSISKKKWPSAVVLAEMSKTMRLCDISRELGIPATTVYYKLQSLGLHKRRRKQATEPPIAKRP